MDESQLNEAFLKKAHKIAFDINNHESPLSHQTLSLKIFLENTLREALRGLAVAVIVATLLQRHSFFAQPSSSKPSNLQIYNRVSIYNEFLSWLCIYDPLELIQNDLEEYGRLVRFYHVNRILRSLFSAGKRLKGMYLAVSACLEGIPDEFDRLYATGGKMSEFTKRRENIYEIVTGVSKGSRINIIQEDSHHLEKKGRKKMRLMQETDSSKTGQQFHIDEEEDERETAEQESRKRKQRKQRSNEQKIEQTHTLNPHYCAKYIAEITD